MPFTFVLLQTINFVLVAASLWIHIKSPLMWDDQAMLISSAAGTLSASLTTIFIGLFLVLREETKWGSILFNLGLAFGFGGLQGFFLFHLLRDIGFFQIIKSKMG